MFINIVILNIYIKRSVIHVFKLKNYLFNYTYIATVTDMKHCCHMRCGLAQQL